MLLQAAGLEDCEDPIEDTLSQPVQVCRLAICLFASPVICRTPQYHACMHMYLNICCRAGGCVDTEELPVQAAAAEVQPAAKALEPAAEALGSPSQMAASDRIEDSDKEGAAKAPQPIASGTLQALFCAVCSHAPWADTMD